MVHGPGPDGPCASCWYGPLRVQKLALSACNDVKSPGQSFLEWPFLGCFLGSQGPTKSSTTHHQNTATLLQKLVKMKYNT